MSDNTTMNWTQLLSVERGGTSGGRDDPSDPRSDFERDYGRILFSEPFRRLMDKTQVFPLPENDHVHNRLIHSVEVASVGRSIARLVAKGLADVDGIGEIEKVVEAACLMHDLGNPPFGHAGESAIRSWFRDERNSGYLQNLQEAERKDLETFEGNAQSFRLATRLAMRRERGGMQLTSATLAAACKYPNSSSEQVHPGKMGYYQDDQAAFDSMVNSVGMKRLEAGWGRHPLAFIVEAADDICYRIMDIEDGVALGLVSGDEVASLLQQIAGEGDVEREGKERDLERVSRWRALAIGSLVKKSADTFLKSCDGILRGDASQAIVEAIEKDVDAVREIKALTKEKCYRARSVELLELVGYEILGGFLDLLVPAVLAVKPDGRQKRLMGLLGTNVVKVDTDYKKILRVTDFVSGMTDGYAVKMYRQLRGVDVGGAWYSTPRS